MRYRAGVVPAPILPICGMNKILQVSENISKMQLTQGYWTLVDTTSLPLLKQYTWWVYRARGRRYAKTTRNGRTLYMHQLLTDAPGDQKVVVDHRDCDGLDNRRSNLRLATRQENARNSPGKLGQRRCRSRGVSKRKHPTQPYGAYIYDSSGHFRHLGYFQTEAEAAAVRQAAAVKMHGDFFWTEPEQDFPEPICA
jgi:hypothetical protein